MHLVAFVKLVYIIYDMETIVNTINGTYIVPADKLDQLLQWLELNAVKPGAKPIGEIKEGQYTGRQLINE